MSAVTSIYFGKGFSRVSQLKINDKTLVTPTYFPSISSAEAQFMLEPLFNTILTTNYPRILISAYDLSHLQKSSHKKMSKLISNYFKKNFVFLDSGTFESYWFHDNNWSISKYNAQIPTISSDFFTSFDSVPSLATPYSQIESETLTHVKKSCKLKSNNICIAVCHGNTSTQLERLIKKLITEFKDIEIISIPERDCGKTIEEKIKNIQRIRKIIDKQNSKILIHILGLGNPQNMALLAFSGADSFDSVDWSRWLIDKRTYQFTDMSNLSLLDCSCKACKSSKMEYTVKALFHNLLFYQEFLESLQKSIIDKSELKFLKQILPKDGFSKLSKFFS